MEDSCSQTASQTTPQTREEKLRCRRERETEQEQRLSKRRTWDQAWWTHYKTSHLSEYHWMCPHGHTHHIPLMTVHGMSELHPPRNVPWHAQACPTMYHIPLVHSNLQLRWLLHVVIYLTQYIWNDRHMSEYFSIQYWHVYVGSPQWLVPLGKLLSVTRLSLGQGYLMELVCDITIGMPHFTLVLLLQKWCHSIVYQCAG